jgi:uracil-DNA glycosylase family 4
MRLRKDTIGEAMPDYKHYCPGCGSINPRVMIVGEAPGKHEEEQKIPFIGPTGAILNEMLTKAGIRREECWLTNVSKFRPPYNDFTKLEQIGVNLNEQIEKLWNEEINAFKPNVILAVGNEAIRAVCGLDGIMKYRGSILAAKDGLRKVVPTIHPAALFSRASESEDEEGKGALSYTYRRLIQHDISRAADESVSPTISLPSRDTDIAHNSLDVFRFFEEYKSCRKTSVDIESIDCIPVSVAFTFNRHHSITIPLISKVKDHLLTDMSRGEIIECWRMIQEALLSKDLVGQNFKYDEYKLRLFGFRVGELLSDTYIKACTIFPELPDKSLGVLTSLWTREPYYKDEGKEPKIGKKFDVKKFFIYNGKDALVTFEIDEEMEKDLESLGEKYGVPVRDFYYNYQMRKHRFYLAMEQAGFAVDFEKKKELKSKYQAMAEAVHQRQFERLGEEFNVKSYPDMFRLLYKVLRFPIRKHQPTSEDAIVALLGSHCKGKDGKFKSSCLLDVLEERRVRDQLSRAINFQVDFDGRCKSGFKINGTETGRSSTQILKKPLRPKKIGLAFHTIPLHGRLGKDIRSMLVPDLGKVILKADYSQAEARIVAVLSEDWELLEAFDKVDIHRRTAALLFGLSKTLDLRPVNLGIIDAMEKDGAMRFTGKMFRHAGNYGMRKRRAANEYNVNAQKYEIDTSISEWKAGEFIETFHRASPKIREVFHKGVIKALDETRVLINPFGRVRLFNERYGEELYKEGFAQIPQSTVADLTQTSALAAFEEFGYDVDTLCYSSKVRDRAAFFVSENHDSLAIQAPANDWQRYARALKKHMTRPVDFSIYCTLRRDYKLVIPVDMEIAEKNYAKFSKVKKEDLVEAA